MTEKLKIKCERPFYSCHGDYNISLLNYYDTHGPTQEFASLFNSHSLLPLINKSTRVTAKSASMIHSIFCNSVLYHDHAINGTL